MVSQNNSSDLHHVVIVGGGCGGLYAAQKLAKAPVKVTLIDKRNFNVFQPLLYQVATGGLSPADISSPLRSLLSKNKNTEVLMGEVTNIDPERQTVKLRYREIKYDSLIVATGVTHQYFGNDWEEKAPGLKTIENALEIRRRVFIAFEAAEKEPNPERRKDWLTFVLVGGGPAGVELAGALAELSHGTLKEDFRNIDTSEAQIILLQSPEYILPVYPPHLSLKAQASLEKLGVTVKTGVRVTDIKGQLVTYRENNILQEIRARTILWTAGMKASPMANILAECADAPLDKAGRVMVEPNFNLPKYENIFVIGDLAHYSNGEGGILPGIAPVAMQEGEYVARFIRNGLQNRPLAPFKYRDWGNLAVIGKHEAVVDMGWLKLSGFLAWFVWLFIHVFYLLEFDNKLIVMIQWAWSYFTDSKGARLITTPGQDPEIKLENDHEQMAYTLSAIEHLSAIAEGKKGITCDISSIDHKQMAFYEVTFNRFDENGDKVLSNGELQALLKALGRSYSTERLGEMMDMVTGHPHSESITLPEFINLIHCDLTDTSEETMLERFRFFDLDGSGRISLEELRLCLRDSETGLSHSEIEEMLRLADTSGDQELSYEEFCEIFEQFKTAVPHC